MVDFETRPTQTTPRRILNPAGELVAIIGRETAEGGVPVATILDTAGNELVAIVGREMRQREIPRVAVLDPADNRVAELAASSAETKLLIEAADGRPVAILTVSAAGKLSLGVCDATGTDVVLQYSPPMSPPKPQQLETPGPATPSPKPGSSNPDPPAALDNLY